MSHPDQVLSLPGATVPFASAQYSGYLHLTPTRHLHYYYVESEGDPESDAVVFWTNGGPGCSGMLGLFSEMGPWRPTANGTLLRNPYSWSRAAGMVFFEQPVGVGFSYDDSVNPQQQGQAPVTAQAGDAPQGDMRAVFDMVAAMKLFFERHPARSGNPVYVSSESYGGHYMPELTLALLQGLGAGVDPGAGAGAGAEAVNAAAAAAEYANSSSVYARFSGVLVGNPYVSFASGEVAGAAATWGYQVVPRPVWRTYDRLGCSDLDSSAFRYSEVCWDLLVLLMDQVDDGGGYSPLWANESFVDSVAAVTAEGEGEAQEQEQRRMETRVDGLGDGKGGLNIYALNFPTCALGNGLADEGQRRGQGQARGIHSAAKRYRSILAGEASKPVSVEAARRRLQAAGVLEPLEGAVEGRVAPTATQSKGRRRRHTSRRARATSSSSSSSSSSNGFPAPGQLQYEPCTAVYTGQYLNRDDVKHALNMYVPSTAGVLVNKTWTECNDPIFRSWPLSDMYGDTTALYAEVHDVLSSRCSGASGAAAGATKERVCNFRMLVYSGDSDGVCATGGTQHWVYNVTKGLHTHTYNGTAYATPSTPFVSYWQQWSLFGQPAGHISVLSPFLAFLTVNDAGHEVPAYQPERSLALIEGYLSGDMFKVGWEGGGGSSGAGSGSSGGALGAFARSVGHLSGDDWSELFVLFFSAVGVVAFLCLVRRQVLLQRQRAGIKYSSRGQRLTQAREVQLSQHQQRRNQIALQGSDGDSVGTDGQTPVHSAMHQREDEGDSYGDEEDTF